MFDERAGDNAAPKLSGGLSLGALSSRSRYPFFVVPERHICGLLIRERVSTAEQELDLIETELGIA
eukprot:COSAG01_NODE_45749_length_406_cov_2.778502_1_plen_65_part_10